ncbi:replication initiation and membrane attachment family protein [Lactiplantibacillus daowaiensis]|uniref:Replication initiation and membrane attachment family protein n=1 Tax=Lactiplantibacillus daowaiensis TaxID=2559918 RepID=A0ABW1RZ97_9LACO|nr:DnaD domain protein [Lactiplantibacillus daowaiensis]
MPDNNPTLTPKAGLIVPTVAALSATEQAILAELYLPLTGALAYSLYAALRSLQREPGDLSRRRSHAELLGILNVDLPTVVTARQKLEATGLLRTYYQQDQIGELYLYQLQAPMTAKQFFDDDLLSVLLLDTVGETRYQQLAADFTPTTVDLSQATEVTADLLSVFHVDSQKVTHTPTEIQQVRQQLPESATRAAAPALATTNFDWQVLGQILQQNYVDLDQVQASRQLIVTESRVYGISEVEMGKLISEVASLTTGKFDANQLKLAIARRYQRPSTPAPVATPAAASAAATATSQSPATELTAAEQQLVAVAKQTSPYDFIEALKKEKHGFVTSGENRLVHDLVGRGVLSNAVINMIIYYLLQNRELTTLNKNLLETMANDWQQHQIATPEAALVYLKQRQQPKPASKRRNQRSNGRPTRKEVVPGWAKKSATSAATTKGSEPSQAMTDADRQKLAARIANLGSNADKEG